MSKYFVTLRKNGEGVEISDSYNKVLESDIFINKLELVCINYLKKDRTRNTIYHTCDGLEYVKVKEIKD